jgi:aryl-alcohol dehydrogenase-like predicted oxidoreductase
MTEAPAPAPPGSRPLGRTGLSVSKVGFGCTGFWARAIFPEAKALALLETALERGINLVDTGPSYGEGVGETRLSKVLSALPQSRHPIVSTKAGTHFDRHGRHYRDFSPRAVRESVSGSLDRLRLPSIDLLHLHGPPLAALTPDLLAVLVDLKNSGAVRHLAVSSSDPQVIQAALKAGVFACFMIEYNFLRKFRLPILQAVGSFGAGILVLTPIARSLFRRSLQPTSIKKLWEFGRALRFHRADLAAARAYDFLNTLPDMTAAQAALAFVLNEQSVSSALFATTSIDHVAQNIAAADIALDPALIAQIRALPDGEAAGPGDLRSYAQAALSMLTRS